MSTRNPSHTSSPSLRAILDYTLEFEEATNVFRQAKKIIEIGNACYEDPFRDDVCGGEKLEQAIKNADAVILAGTKIYLIYY